MKDHLGAKLDAYLDGSLEDKDKIEVENHLRNCPTCKSEIKKLKDLSERIEDAKPAAVPKGAFKTYWDRLLGRHKEVNTMTAIQRVKRVVESNIHSAIDAMEEPSKMIKQLLREMEAAISDAREEVVESIVIEKGLTHRCQEACSSVKKWEDRAALALKNGREDLAREALKEQMGLEALADDFKQESEKQKARVSELKGALVRLERQFQDLKRRKTMWISQVQNSLGRSSSRKAYQTAYSELARVLDVTQEKSVVETTYSEIYTTQSLEETIDEMDQKQVLEQKLTVLKQRLQQ